MKHQEKYSCDWQLVNELQLSANDMLNWLLQGKSRVLESVPVYEIDKLRRQLRSVYGLLPRKEGKDEVLLQEYKPLSNGLEKVVNIFSGAENSFIDVVLHGSWGTNEVISGWSDVDVFAIVRREVFDNSELFLELRSVALKAEEEIYKVDPWQHHGIQYISEDDMFYYPEALLPLNVMRRGKSLLGDNQLKFVVRNSKNEKEERFLSIKKLFVEAASSSFLKHHARNNVYLADNFGNKEDNFYQLKYFISVVLLLPSLYLELIGRPVFKKESFVKIKKYFNEKDLELVKACEEARLACGDVVLKDNIIPKEVESKLGVNYFKRASVLMDKLVKEYELR